MKTWASRSKEEAHLLNPAFCCTMLAAAINGYSGVKKEGMAFPLVFMIAPIVLHKPTRIALPQNIRTSMAAWLQENASARVQFYERLVSLKPYTREAIQFGMLHNWIVPRSGGLVETTFKKSNINRATKELIGEARECIMRAKFIGRWFATAGDDYTVMAFWGIRP